MAKFPTANQLSNYWAKFYVNSTVLLCSLCGNKGIIDTRERAKSAAGVEAGKLNWCICPNGQAYRKHHNSAEPSQPEGMERSRVPNA